MYVCVCVLCWCNNKSHFELIIEEQIVIIACFSLFWQKLLIGTADGGIKAWNAVAKRVVCDLSTTEAYPRFITIFKNTVNDWNIVVYLLQLICLFPVILRGVVLWTWNAVPWNQFLSLQQHPEGTVLAVVCTHSTIFQVLSSLYLSEIASVIHTLNFLIISSYEHILYSILLTS